MSATTDPTIYTTLPTLGNTEEISTQVESNLTVLETGQAPVKLYLLPPLMLLSFFTCSINIIVMLCTRLEKKLRNVTNIYIFSVAVADFLVGLVAMNFQTLFNVLGYWPFGDYICTLWICMDGSTSITSLCHICVIAWDRMIALTKPLEYKNQTSKMAIRNSLLTWAAVICFILSTVISIRNNQYKEPLTCYFFPAAYVVLLESVGAFHIPMLGVAILYIACLYQLMKRKKQIAPSSAKQKATLLNVLFIQNEYSTTMASSTTNTTSVIPSCSTEGVKKGEHNIILIQLQGSLMQ